jgi:hypothetical protein
MSLVSKFTKLDMNQPDFFLTGETFQITEDGRLVFFAERFPKFSKLPADIIKEILFQINKEGRAERFKSPTAPLPDFSKLPADIVREILTYLREPSAECIATQLFLETELQIPFLRQGVQSYGTIWRNLDGWFIFHRRWTTERDIVFKTEYTIEAREYAGHLTHKLWKEARERVLIYKYNCKSRMTPTNHKAWLRQQLAMNNICPIRASRKTLWKLFMALD